MNRVRAQTNYSSWSQLFNTQIAAATLPAPVAVYRYEALLSSRNAPTEFTTFPSSGWMAALVRCTDSFGAARRVVCALDMGSSGNLLGIQYQVVSSGAQASAYIRAASTTINSVESNYRYVPNAIDPVILTWNTVGADTTFKLFFQGQVTTGTITTPAFNSNFTKFVIGARSGGSEPLGGSVNYVELGTGTYLSDIQCAALALRMANPLCIAPIGQSNIEKTLFNSDETSLPIGKEALIPLLKVYDGSPVVVLPTAVGGSSILKTAISGGVNCYWNDETNSPAPNLLAWYEIVKASGLSPQLVVFDQGEAESHKIDHPSYPTVTKATYKAGIYSVFNWVRARYPTVQFQIVPIGIRTDGGYTSTYRGLQTAVDVHNEIILENPSWISFGYTRYDLALSDGVHMTNASILTAVTRLSNAINRLFGATVTTGTNGPQLASATRVTTAVTVTITHDAGTDFTPTTGIEGICFVRDSDGVVFTPTAAIRTSATVVTLTLASDPASAGKVYAAFDNQAITLANILKDNTATALPLRRGYVSCN